MKNLFVKSSFVSTAFVIVAIQLGLMSHSATSVFPQAMAFASQEKLDNEDESKFDKEMVSLLKGRKQSDSEPLNKIIKECDKQIAKSELVGLANAWKGTALVMDSASLFQAGNWQDGLKKWNAGLNLIDELDLDAESTFTNNRVAGVCLAAWTHEQDADRAKQIAKRGLEAFSNAFGSDSAAWKAQPDEQKLALLEKAVVASIAAEPVDDVNAEKFFQAMKEISPDHELTIKAKNSIAKGSTTGRVKTKPRFDDLVREDFFDGIFNEDEAAFKRAMTLCREALESDQKNYEAMVWLGSGNLYEAGKARNEGDTKTGDKLWSEGLEKMHVACAAKPDDISVLIPRAATLVGIGRILPMPESDRLALLNLAVYDYEKTMQLQEAYFDNLSSHAKSELLFGLADGWHQLNNQEKANSYFERVIKIDPKSEQANMANLFLNGKGNKELLKHRNCVGCH